MKHLQTSRTQPRSLLSKIIHRYHNESGVAAVEIGATMLVFMMALFSVVEFGWYFLHQNTLTAAVRNGIRLGAIGSTLNDDNGNGLSRADSIKKAIKDNAATVMDIDTSMIQIFPVQADWSDPNNAAVANNAGGAGAFMRVRVAYDHEFFTPLIGGFFGGGTFQQVTSGTYRNENFILGGGS